MVDFDFGTREYWELERTKTKNRLIDIEEHIDSLLYDVNDLKRRREELADEYKTICEEIDSIEQKEREEQHNILMKTNMVYRALHTPSQTKILNG